MMDPDYDLFATIVAEGSLSGAGRRAGISPAMVSKRLGRLEDRLGVRLVHRTTRRLALTPHGERFHADLLKIFASVKDAEERVTGASGKPAGPLRVSVPTSFGRMHVAPHLHRFLADHPHIELELDLSDAFVDMFSGKVDLAIRITAAIDPALSAHRLAASERMLCAAPSYLENFGVPASIADLKKHRLLAAVGQLPWHLSGPSGAVVVDGASYVQTNSSEVVRELTLSGVGIALRSLWDVGADLAEGRLVRILGDHHGSLDVGIFAVHPIMPNPPSALTAFIRFLADLYRSQAPWETRVQ